MKTLLFLPCALAIGSASAQSLPFVPDTSYDPAVPTMQSVLGYAPGERICSHAEAARYARALADASDRVMMRRYGSSWEERELYYLVVSSRANLQRLDAIRAGMQKLADPRRVDSAEVDRLLDDLPAVTWLAYTVHGDEISGTDAALALAHHLVAAQDDTLCSTILDQSVVIIDPLQNPDGRERFVHHFRSTRGRWPDAEPDAAEHDQPWPGGRTNHYLFDMNRDWFAQTQIETRARVAAFLEWWPVVYVDLHEMGSNSTYYFPPPAKPQNPEITDEQASWLERYGRNNAKWFDRFGFDYFTREAFDSFYPGYGEGWPLFHGSVGMTYEQASVRGLIVRRDDELEMRYRDSVHRHFIASLATAETVAQGRREALKAFYDYRRTAIERGSTGPVREYLLPPGTDRHRTAKLAQLLARQGIEVHRATTGFENDAVRTGDSRAKRSFPAGTFVVRLAQPASRLATVLLTQHQDMEADFVAEQKQKYAKRQRTEIYDMTGWSLPLLFGVECVEAESASDGAFERVTATTDAPRIEPEAFGGSPRAAVAYVIPSGSNHVGRALAELFRREVRVHCADESFRIGDRTFDRGSLLVKVRENQDDVHAIVWSLDQWLGLDVHAADSSWVDEGAHFGSNDVHYLKPPKVLMAWDRPVRSNSAGWTRYLLEQAYGYPITVVRTRRLSSVELKRFDVLVLPDGSDYADVIRPTVAKRIGGWVRDGGTLIAIGNATKWLTGKDVELLAASAEKRQGTKPEDDDETDAETDTEKTEQKPEAKKPKPYDYDSAVIPEDERPARTPGAILHVELDPEHWLAFGCGSSVDVVSMGRDVFTPLKLDKGTNVGVFAKRDSLLMSGFAWQDKLDQLARKPWLVHQPHGDGHVVAFAEDPNTRAFCDGTNLLFLNAVFLGPGH